MLWIETSLTAHNTSAESTKVYRGCGSMYRYRYTRGVGVCTDVGIPGVQVGVCTDVGIPWVQVGVCTDVGLCTVMLHIHVP